MRYHRPVSTADALDLLGQDNAKPLLGGTDLIVGLRHGTLTAEHVVDLKHLTDLPPPVTVDADGVRIGATARLASLSSDDRLAQRYPALVEGAGCVGSVQIRNRASLVGNVCNASPVADTVPALLVYGAVARIASSSGERDVPLADFFLGFRRTACAATEIVTSVWLPTPAPGSGSAFLRLTRRHGVDLATVSAAAYVDRTGRVAIGLGAVGPRPLLAELPRPVDPEDEVAMLGELEAVLDVATPISDVRSTREYRHAMVRVLARRAVRTAAQRARNGSR